MSKRLRGPGDLSGQCDVILAACVAFCLALALDAAGEGSGRLDSGEDRLDGSQRGVGGAEGLSKLREWTAEDAGALLAKRDVRQSFARDARGMAPRWTDDNNALILATGIPILARRTDEGYDTAVREVTDSYAALGIFLGFEPALGSADQLWLEAGISEPGAQVLERFRENLSLKELLKGLRQAGLLREEADAVADRALQILIDTRGFADAWDSVKGLTLRDRSMMAQSLLKAIEEHGGDKPFDLVSDIPYWALSVDRGDFDSLLRKVVDGGSGTFVDSVQRGVLPGPEAFSLYLRGVREFAAKGDIESALAVMRSIKNEFGLNMAPGYSYAPYELLEIIAREDPQRAFEVSEEFGGGRHYLGYMTLAQRDLGAAWAELLAAEPGGARWAAIRGIAYGAAGADLEGLDALLAQLPPGERAYAHSLKFMTLSKSDLHAAKRGAEELPAAEGQASVLRLMTPALVEDDPQQGADWLQGVTASDPDMQEAVIHSLVMVWARKDPRAVSEWLRAEDLPVAAWEGAIKGFVPAIAATYPREAVEWVQSVEDAGARAGILQEVQMHSVDLTKIAEFMVLARGKGLVR